MRLRQAVLGVGLAAGLVPAAAGDGPGYRLIVNAANPLATLRREDAAKLFLERNAVWKHGPPADPVDQSATSPVRQGFSTEVLGQPVAGIENYWRKRMLERREAPPKVKTSDDEVIAYVAKSPGGIGYVSAAANLPPSVKEIRVSEPAH